MKSTKDGVTTYYTRVPECFNEEMLAAQKTDEFKDYFRSLPYNDVAFRRMARNQALESWLHDNIPSYKLRERSRKIREEEYGVEYPQEVAGMPFTHYAIDCIDFTNEDDLKKYVAHFEWRTDYQNLTLFADVMLKLSDTEISHASYREDGWWDRDLVKLFSFKDHNEFVIT